jgi:high-affinity iron transporter
VLGWQNSATLGSVLSYNLYWLFVMAMFASMRFKEVRGNWPWMRPKKGAAGRSASVGSGSGDDKDKDEKVVSVQPLRTLEA